MSARRRAKRGTPAKFKTLPRKEIRMKPNSKRMQRSHYVPCVECGDMGKPVTGDVLFPDQPENHHRLYYVCQCGAYVGSIKGGHPAGYPAGPTTRFARAIAHERADALWRHGFMASRAAVYAWLAEKMGKDTLSFSISRTTRLESYKVTRLCEERWDEAKRDAEAQAAADRKEVAAVEHKLEAKADEAFKKAPPSFLGTAAHAEDSSAGLSSVRPPGDRPSRDGLC